MWELFSQASSIGVFLAIAAVGFLILLLSLIFGEIFDLFGDFDHDWNHDLSHGGPGFLSSRVISVFITAFGGTGAIAASRGYPVLTSSILGLVIGVLLATPVYFFARFLYSQQSSSLVQVSDLVGRTAEVTVGIPEGNLGRIRCLLGESVVEKTARSRDGLPIALNSLVRVEEVVGESVVVSRLPLEAESKAASVKPS